MAALVQQPASAFHHRLPKRMRLLTEHAADPGAPGAEDAWCTKCEQRLPAACFYQQSLARNFWTCKSCKNKQDSDRRRADPAARLVSRLRIRARRAGVPLRVGVPEVRRLLASEPDQRYVAEDLVALRPLRASEPLSADNLRLVRLGHIIRLDEEEEAQLRGGGALAACAA